MTEKETRRRRPMMGPGGHGGHKIEKAKDVRATFRRLENYFQPYTLQLTVIFIFIVIYTLLGLLGPYLMGLAIDEVIYVGGDKARLVQLVLLMLGAYLGAGLTSIVHGPLPSQKGPKVVVSFCKVGSNLHRLGEIGNRLLKPAQPGQGQPHVIMGPLKTGFNA